MEEEITFMDLGDLNNKDSEELLSIVGEESDSLSDEVIARSGSIFETKSNKKCKNSVTDRSQKSVSRPPIFTTLDMDPNGVQPYSDAESQEIYENGTYNCIPEPQYNMQCPPPLQYNMPNMAPIMHHNPLYIPDIQNSGHNNIYPIPQYNYENGVRPFHPSVPMVNPYMFDNRLYVGHNMNSPYVSTDGNNKQHKNKRLKKFKPIDGGSSLENGYNEQYNGNYICLYPMPYDPHNPNYIPYVQSNYNSDPSYINQDQNVYQHQIPQDMATTNMQPCPPYYEYNVPIMNNECANNGYESIPNMNGLPNGDMYIEDCNQSECQESPVSITFNEVSSQIQEPPVSITFNEVNSQIQEPPVSITFNEVTSQIHELAIEPNIIEIQEGVELAVGTAQNVIETNINGTQEVIKLADSKSHHVSDATNNGCQEVDESSVSKVKEVIEPMTNGSQEIKELCSDRVEKVNKPIVNCCLTVHDEKIIEGNDNKLPTFQGIQNGVSIPEEELEEAIEPTNIQPTITAEKKKRKRNKKKKKQNKELVSCSSTGDSDSNTRCPTPVAEDEVKLPMNPPIVTNAIPESKSSLVCNGLSLKDSRNDVSPDSTKLECNTPSSSSAKSNTPSSSAKSNPPSSSSAWGSRKSWSQVFGTKQQSPKSNLIPDADNEIDDNCPVEPVKMVRDEENKQKISETIFAFKESHFSHKQLLPRGLINKRIWCYINSLLQALIACRPFLSMMQSVMKSVPNLETLDYFPFLSSFSKFILMYSDVQEIMRPTFKGKVQANKVVETGVPFEPASIYDLLLTVGSDQFEDANQQDAHEALNFLLNGLHEEISECLGLNGVAGGAPSSAEDGDEWQMKGPKGKSCVTRTTPFHQTPFSEIFWGEFRYIQKTKTVSSANVQPYNTLLLDVQSPKVNTLEDAFDQLVLKEEISGYTCDKTKQETTVVKQVLLQTLPKVLILHLNRFTYGEKGLMKDNKKIDFSVDLEIRKELIYQNRNKKDKKSERTYALFAVVKHEGPMATKGHYICEVNRGGKNWIRCDDSNVKSVTVEDVLKYDRSQVPYLLFYQRTDTLESYTNGY